MKTGESEQSGERLQKVLAQAGLGSRRACEELITAGKVRVDGQVVRELGTRVDPRRANIEVNGEPIKLSKRRVYLAMYKQRGVLSDAGSPDDEVTTVLDLAPQDEGHLFPIGRLDLPSEGLILLTSDGELTNRLTHPRYEHAKVYYVLVEKRPGDADLQRLRSGIELEDGKTAPAKIEVVEHLPAELKLDSGPLRGVWLRFELTEGKKRQIRHMTMAIGLPTLRLIRWSIGPLALRTMAPGEWRYLTLDETRKLLSYAGLSTSTPARSGRSGGRPDANRAGQKGPGQKGPGQKGSRKGPPGPRGGPKGAPSKANRGQTHRPAGRGGRGASGPRGRG
jgi:23S rRNA pseudouridine2605 synthase